MDRILGHQNLKMATYTWPGFFPSPCLTPLLRKEVSLLAAEKNQVGVVVISYVGGGVTAGTTELVKYLFNGVVGRILVVLLAIWMFKLYL